MTTPTWSYQRIAETYAEDSIAVLDAYARKTLYTPSQSEIPGYYWGVVQFPQCVRITPDTALITYYFDLDGSYKDSMVESSLRLLGSILSDTTVFEPRDSTRIEELEGKPTPPFQGTQYEFHKVDSIIFLIPRAHRLTFARFMLSNGDVDDFAVVYIYRKLSPNASQLQRFYKQQAQHARGAFMESLALPTIIIFVYLAVVIYVLILLTRLVKAVERISDKLSQ